MANSEKFLELEQLKYLKGKIDLELQGKQNVLIVGTNLDSVPTQNSTNPITSGGVYTVLGDINTVLESLL